MIKLLLLICLTFLVSNTYSETLTGKVIKVSDGDTINILVKKKKYRIRFNAIDCPERKQPYGKQAKNALAKTIAGKVVDVIKLGTDRYKRIIGEVYYKDININRKLVHDGHCWVYRKYNKDPSMIRLESEAKEDKRGLWKLPEHQRIPPWEYRKSKRKK